MGVWGLTTFVRDHQEGLFEETEISDCRLVIDGNALKHFLLDSHELPISQEYEDNCKRMMLFIHSLRSHNVEPYVVFDGPSTLDKREKLRETMASRVEKFESLFHKHEPNSKVSIPIPTHTQDAMKHVLTELAVPFCTSLEDADAATVAVANKFECPVLSNDSDFFVFNVENGYLPAQYFNWSVVKEEQEERNKIKCWRYKQSLFCKKFNIAPRHLPFLSILVGNDWVDRDVFSQFKQNLCKKMNIGYSMKERYIQTAIKWLSTFPNDEIGTRFVFNELTRALPFEIRSKYMEKIKTCYDLYKKLPDIADLLQILERRNHCNELVSKPDNLEAAIRHDFVHFSFYHACRYGYIYLSTAIVCDTEKRSPHFCCREIRDMALTLLFRRFFRIPCRARFFVAEYDKTDEDYYGKARVMNIFIPRCPVCNTEHLFEESCESFNFIGIIAKILSLDVKRSPSDMLNELVKNCFLPRYCLRVNIVILSALYWFKKTSPKSRHVVVLMLSIAGYLHRYIDRKLGIPWTALRRVTRSDRDITWDIRGHEERMSRRSSAAVEENGAQDPDISFSYSRTLHDSLLPGCKTSDEESADGDDWCVKNPDFPVDMELLHSIAEWECVLLAAFSLYQCVEYDGIFLGLHRLYGSNLAAHEFNARLMKSPDLVNLENKELRCYYNAVLKKIVDNSHNRILLFGDLFSCIVEFLLQ